jgi:hypothetical protein
MEINDFMGIAIVGAALSVVIQAIKNRFGTESGETKALTIALSLVVGAAYVGIRSTPYFETVILVLGSASAVYAILMR